MDLQGRVAIVTGAAAAGLIRFTACMAYAREETGVRVSCVVPDWIATDRAYRELPAMTAEQRAAEAPLVDPSDLADAVVELIRDESLSGRVVLLPRGRPAAPVGSRGVAAQSRHERG